MAVGWAVDLAVLQLRCAIRSSCEPSGSLAAGMSMRFLTGVKNYPWLIQSLFNAALTRK